MSSASTHDNAQVFSRKGDRDPAVVRVVRDALSHYFETAPDNLKVVVWSNSYYLLIFNFLVWNDWTGV